QGGEAVGRGASQALNDAVLQLRDAESSMCKNPGSSSGGQQSAQGQGMQMQQMSESQSRLNMRTQRLTQRLTQQVRMTQGDEAEMRRLAEEQARIREQLEQVQKDEKAEKKLLGRLDQT